MSIFLILSTLIILIVALSAINHYKIKRIALERGDPNICEYARSFDYRNIDTKIIREVWNELQLNLGNFNNKPFPIKADDFFEETYDMHPDDLDDIYIAVASRLCIDTSQPEKNPYYNQVTTVKNLVLFLHNQPKINHA